MRTEVFGLLALESTNVVMKLEKEFLEMGLNIRIIPVPKEVTANCGLSLKFDLEDREKIKVHMDTENLRGEFFRITKNGLKKEVEKI